MSFFSIAATASPINKNLIPQTNVLRGEFRQARTLQGFKKPLVSEGKFLVSKDNGVVWQHQKPFPSILLIRNNGIIVRLDKPQKNAANVRKKGNSQISKILLAVLSGDDKTIAKYFDVTQTGSDATWAMQLTPKAQVAKALQRVEISGNKHIEKVLMLEKNGDQTEWFFSAVSETPALLVPKRHCISNECFQVPHWHYRRQHLVIADARLDGASDTILA
jgi:outer membrane lipoprotein-sorting protein